MDSRSAARVRRWIDWTRFHVGLWLAMILWTVADCLTAVGGNWLEDLATAKHPLSFKTHWARRHDVLNGWQR